MKICIISNRIYSVAILSLSAFAQWSHADLPELKLKADCYTVSQNVDIGRRPFFISSHENPFHHHDMNFTEIALSIIPEGRYPQKDYILLLSRFPGNSFLKSNFAEYVYEVGRVDGPTQAQALISDPELKSQAYQSLREKYFDNSPGPSNSAISVYQDEKGVWKNAETDADAFPLTMTMNYKRLLDRPASCNPFKSKEIMDQTITCNLELVQDQVKESVQAPAAELQAQAQPEPPK